MEAACQASNSVPAKSVSSSSASKAAHWPPIAFVVVATLVEATSADVVAISADVVAASADVATLVEATSADVVAAGGPAVVVVVVVSAASVVVSPPHAPQDLAQLKSM